MSHHKGYISPEESFLGDPSKKEFILLEVPSIGAYSPFLTRLGISMQLCLMTVHVRVHKA